MNLTPVPNPSSSAPAATSGGNGTSSGTNSLTNGTQSMFLQLLTAQLENQSPLDPVDPTQFTDQLVEFNMLDQLTQINNTLTNAFPTAASGTASSSAAGSNGNSTNASGTTPTAPS